MPTTSDYIKAISTFVLVVFFIVCMAILALIGAFAWFGPMGVVAMFIAFIVTCLSLLIFSGKIQFHF